MNWEIFHQEPPKMKCLPSTMKIHLLKTTLRAHGGCLLKMGFFLYNPNYNWIHQHIIFKVAVPWNNKLYRDNLVGAGRRTGIKGENNQQVKIKYNKISVRQIMTLWNKIFQICIQYSINLFIHKIKKQETDNIEVTGSIPVTDQ